VARPKIVPKFGCNRCEPAIGTKSQRFRLKPAVAERYSRQILFEGIGKKGQLNISRSFAVVVGAGAIGSAACEMLVRAGIGRIRIIDKDFVELSNLQRQSLFTEEDIGKEKAHAAAEKLAQINSGAHVEPVVQEFSPESAESLVFDADIVLDATDNMETRFLINDACAKLGKPWIFASATIFPTRIFFPSTVFTYAIITPACRSCFLRLRRRLFFRRPSHRFLECSKFSLLSARSRNP